MWHANVYTIVYRLRTLKSKLILRPHPQSPQNKDFLIIQLSAKTFYFTRVHEFLFLLSVPYTYVILILSFLQELLLHKFPSYLRIPLYFHLVFLSVLYLYISPTASDPTLFSIYRTRQKCGILLFFFHFRCMTKPSLPWQCAIRLV